MEIDWFTFGAQIANFLLLVWLLKRFLYGPIVSAMSEREERIAARFDEAREKREEAEAEAAEYRQRKQELETAREEKMEEAETEAHEHREELIEEARAEVDHMETQWKEALQRERETFLKELSHRVGQETLSIARRTLRDLADAELERQVVRIFLDRLESLDQEQREDLRETIHSDRHDVTVHTAFELREDEKQSLVDILQSVGETTVEPEFDRDGDVGFGIEIRAGGQKIAWSLESYFGDLEDRIGAQIDAELPEHATDAARQQPSLDSDSASASRAPSQPS